MGERMGEARGTRGVRRWRQAAAGATLAAIAVAGGCTSEASPRGAAGSSAARVADPTLPVVTVYKDPHCGCCNKWIDRMRDAGFTVQALDVPLSQARDEIRRKQSVTSALAACHTALVGGYVVEGHVPPDLVKQMLAEHPAIAGLSVPGMVRGSPGMESGTPSHYDVLAFTQSGETRVYASR
jgi:hypothetical protein